MSSIGKILLYVALAGLIAAAVGAWLLVQKYHETNDSLVLAQQNLDVAKKATADALKAKETAIKEKEATDSALADTKANLDSVQGKFDDLTKQQADIKAALDTAKANADKAAQDLKHVTDVLGMSPEDAKAAMQKALDAQTAAQTEQKILADQLQDTTVKLKTFMDNVSKGPNKMPPGISGKVTAVNRSWNFVVLDVGLSNGLVPKGELIVYRGNRFLGRSKITSVEENTAVADIEPDATGDIQMSDSVLN